MQKGKPMKTTASLAVATKNKTELPKRDTNCQMKKQGSCNAKTKGERAPHDLICRNVTDSKCGFVLRKRIVREHRRRER